MQVTLKVFLLILVVFLLIDSIWVGFISRPYWDALIQKMTGSPMVVNGLAAAISYLLLTIGLTFLVYQQIREESSIKDSIFYGILFGLVVYGVFDFTNMAIFQNYSVPLALADTAWGMFVSAVTMLIVTTIVKRNTFF